MKVYGLRIGDVGVEFSSLQDRENAMLKFTKGTCMAINDSAGQRYKDSSGTFSVYERDTKEIIMNCDGCKCQISQDSCTKRDVPYQDWNGRFASDLDKTESKIICDACHARILADFEKHKAKKILNQSS